MKIKNVFSIIILLFFTNIIFAQTNSDKYSSAMKLQENHSFRASLNLLFELSEAEPDNSNIYYQIGFNYVQLDQLDSAIIFLEKTKDSLNTSYNNKFETKSAPADSWFLLARCYQISYMFEEAIFTYDTLKQFVTNKSEIEKINRRLTECETALEFLKEPINVTIMPLNRVINSEYKEHSPVISADLQTLIFTSNRKGTGGNVDVNGNYFEDIYISKLVNGSWSAPESQSRLRRG